MSENASEPQPTSPLTDPVAEEAPTPPAADSPAAANPIDDESTIGTGTSMALGCIAGTVLLIAFGLLFLFISTLI